MIVVSPIITGILSRLVRPLLVFLDVYSDTLSVSISNRLTIVCILLVILFSGFKPIWNLLALTARSSYVKNLAIGKEVKSIFKFSNTEYYMVMIPLLFMLSYTGIYILSSAIVGFTIALSALSLMILFSRESRKALLIFLGILFHLPVIPLASLMFSIVLVLNAVLKDKIPVLSG